MQQYSESHNTNLKRQEYSTLSKQISRMKRKQGQLKDAQDCRTLGLVDLLSLKPHLSKRGRVSFLQSEVNVRTMMLPFQLGLGGSDIAMMLSMLGLEGSSGFERRVGPRV